MRQVDAWDETMRLICSADAFVAGSTLPDRSLLLRILPHTFPGSKRIVRSLLRTLLTNDLTPDAFGRSLGIVCHFLSDYACAYHSNKRLSKRILPHRAYEQKIDRLTLRNPSDDPFIRSLSTLFEDLEHYIAKRHYATSFEDPSQDLEDAMTLTARVTNLVFTAVTEMTFNNPVCPVSSNPHPAAFAHHT